MSSAKIKTRKTALPGHSFLRNGPDIFTRACPQTFAIRTAINYCWNTFAISRALARSLAVLSILSVLQNMSSSRWPTIAHACNSVELVQKLSRRFINECYVRIISAIHVLSDILGINKPPENRVAFYSRKRA